MLDNSASQLINDVSFELYSERNAKLDKYASLIHILNGQEEFLLDEQGFIVSSNLEVVNVTGYEEYEVLGKHISIFYLASESDKCALDIQRAKNLGRNIVTGMRLKKKGASFWAKMKIESIKSNTQSAPKYKVVLQDATHRALSDFRVKTIKDEYLAIFNNPFVGTFKFRCKDFKVQMCNDKALEIVELKNKDAEVLFFDSFFYSKEEFKNFIELLKRDKKTEGFKFLINDKKKTGANWAVISARYFVSKDFVEGVLIDISEQHNQSAELDRVNTELNNFVYHASHDFRAPLLTILGLANLGIKDASLENVHQYLRLIHGTAKQLDALLKDLTSISYNSNVNLAYQPFDFNNEVDQILTEMDTTSHPARFNLSIHGTSAFETDAMRMRTILRNMLLNSFKYFDPELPVLTVDLRIFISATQASIELTDNGIGIDPSLSGRIFELFFRGTVNSTGAGLGLYIVKAMIDKLKGTIELRSDTNRGSCFLLAIPNCA
jgi:PAS domain S-box-containing protein